MSLTSVPVTYTAGSDVTVHGVTVHRAGAVVCLTVQFDAPVMSSGATIMTFSGLPTPSRAVITTASNSNTALSLELTTSGVLKCGGSSTVARVWMSVTATYLTTD